jgi:hypothetical protein
VAACSEPEAESVGEVEGKQERVYQGSNIVAGAAIDSYAADSYERPVAIEEVAIALAEPPVHPETVIADNHNQNEDNLDIPAFLRRGGL